MDDITLQEKEVIDELRRRTINDATPKMLEDISLFYRFAKGRGFNLKEAESMLRKHIAWRKEIQVDSILTDYEPPEGYIKYIPVTIIGFDREGGIARYMDGGGIDANGLWNLGKKTELEKYFVYLMEQDKDLLIKKGRNLGTPIFSTIYDLDGLTYANAMSIKCMQYSLHFVKMFLDNYPETVRRISIINAPSHFTWLYSAFKQVIPKTVHHKLRIYGKDGWKEELLEIIDADTLPVFLGGTRTDPDGNPFCKTFIPRGKPIPKSYFMKEKSKKLSLASDALKMTVQPFSKEKISFDVKEENAHLEWEIEIKNRNIDFSLHFGGGGSESDEIIFKRRIDADEEPEKGFCKCEKIGRYTMVFDNTYCWIYSKELYYKAEIYKESKE